MFNWDLVINVRRLHHRQWWWWRLICTRRRLWSGSVFGLGWAWEVVGQVPLKGGEWLRGGGLLRGGEYLGGWGLAVGAEGFVVNGRAREMGLDLDRLVGDLFHGWRRRAGGFVAVYIGGGAAGVFVGGLSLWWVRVLAYTEGFPDASSMEFGIFDLLEGLGEWGVGSVSKWFGLVQQDEFIRDYLWVKVAEDFADFEEGRAG